MKKVTAALVLIALTSVSLGASATIFDYKGSLGLTQVSTKNITDGVEEKYVGTLCLVSAELGNDTAVEKTLTMQTYTKGSLLPGAPINPSFKQGNDSVIRLQSGESVALLDEGQAGDNIFINGDPQTPMTVGMTFDTAGAVGCTPVEMELSVRKTMQELKVRKTMQELKVRKTMQELKLTFFNPDGTPTRVVWLPEVGDEVLVFHADGTIDMTMSLIAPIAMTKG